MMISTTNRIDWQARVRRLAQACQYARGHQACWAAERDTGSVPPEVMSRLCGLAARLGYPVKLGDPGEGSLGVTCSYRDGSGVNGITLLDGMSPASTARVLGHELGHARVRATESEAAFRNACWEDLLSPFLGTSLEEAECELGTAAFCEAAGIGTGGFSRDYMAEQFGQGYVVPADRLDVAAENAKMLWEAVN